ncbi:DUF624 domain-containing protein [Virgibacillus necropolis]|uniref:DUF624 domain-containing protein n=1 Tax=Virgibacillus necropolis TaxID=163877 RepID=A0A221M9K1_9BACI|nr:DUF624 domain-containing protein [Virgibacillus necropolis]ASN04317.1 hypothetical protein CFK40_04480 [Virgibacillus necropolis]
MEEKIIEGLEILWNIFVLSLLVITFSLLIISIVPSFLACISVVRQLKEKKVSNLDINVIAFWGNFKSYFWKGVIVQLFGAVVLVVAYINFQLIIQSNNSIEKFIVITVTITFLIITLMFLLNLMYGITIKHVNVKLLEHNLLLVFAKLPIVLLLSLCYLLFFVTAFLLPQVLILTVGLLILIHYKTGSKIWEQFDQV